MDVASLLLVFHPVGERIEKRMQMSPAPCVIRTSSPLRLMSRSIPAWSPRAPGCHRSLSSCAGSA